MLLFLVLSTASTPSKIHTFNMVFAILGESPTRHQLVAACQQHHTTVTSSRHTTVTHLADCSAISFLHCCNSVTAARSNEAALSFRLIHKL
jgi:hypothetical protein